jgi:hypothetical protein
MSAPLNARLDDSGRRYYTWNGERYWSVTTLIDMGVPKYLVPWASKLIAELAYADVAKHGKRALKVWEKAGRAEFARLQAEGGLVSYTPAKIAKLGPADYALRWLKGTSDRVRDAAADRGSKVHEITEDVVKAAANEAERLVIAGADRLTILARCGEETRPYVESHLNWIDDFRPLFLMTEATVYNRSAGWAGTLDDGFILPTIWPGEPVCNDKKTGREIYAEVALQVAAYARGEFVGMPDGSEMALPRFRHGTVLHLLPGPTSKFPRGYEFRELRINDDVYRSFLYACEVARFRLETASTVIGEPIVPDLADALAASLEAVGA